MGRKPSAKTRLQNPVLKERWARKVSPLLLGQGIRSFTMDDIVRELSCSKATLYKYFSQKKDLVEAVVQLKIQQIAAFAPILRDQQRAYPERFSDAIQTASLEMAGISSLFLNDLKELYPDLWQLVQQLQELAYQAMADFYREGIDNKWLHPNLDPEVLALTDKLFIVGISDPSQLEGHDIDLKTAFDSYQHVRRHGIFRR